MQKPFLILILFLPSIKIFALETKNELRPEIKKEICRQKRSDSCPKDFSPHEYKKKDTNPSYSCDEDWRSYWLEVDQKDSDSDFEF